MKSSVDNLSLVFQALSLAILFQDYNNIDLMQELRQQDTNYFEKIVDQNTKILKILEGGEYEGNRNDDQNKGSSSKTIRNNY